jgi:neutral ceramidase
MLALLSTACAGVAKEERAHWKVGTARAVITPNEPVWLAGYGAKRVPEGKLHDLWVKVLALEDEDGHRAVLITSDHMGIPQVIYESLVNRLHTQFNLDRSDVMLTFSHNHCGPRLREDLVDYYPVDAEQTALVRRYSDAMEATTVDAVGRALAALAPAGLSMGEGATTFAVNRRNNAEADVLRLRDAGTPLKGPVDHSVPVLAARNDAGRLTALLFGYACHPTTLDFTQWCGDYPGFAQLALEKAHPHAMAMFFTACGADQNPLPRRTVELCERYGHMLSDAVETVLARPMKPVGPRLRTAFAFVDLPYDRIVTRPELEAGRTSDNPIYARWAARMLKRLDDNERFRPAYSYPVQVWRLGKELLLIALGGEAVVDYSLRFRREYGPRTWVCGYANTLVAYIPSRRVWQEGGYEGGSYLYEYGHPAVRWAGDVEDRIAGTVARLVREVNSPLTATQGGKP